MTFIKGKSGNENGRPKKDWTWASLIEEEADKLVDSKDKTKGTVKKAITKALMDKAKQGDVQAYKELANRTDGLPQQSVDLTSKGKSITPIYGAKSIQGYESNSESVQSEEED